MSMRKNILAWGKWLGLLAFVLLLFVYAGMAKAETLSCQPQSGADGEYTICKSGSLTHTPTGISLEYVRYQKNYILFKLTGAQGSYLSLPFNSSAAIISDDQTNRLSISYLSADEQKATVKVWSNSAIETGGGVSMLSLANFKKLNYQIINFENTAIDPGSGYWDKNGVKFTSANGQALYLNDYNRGGKTSSGNYSISNIASWPETSQNDALVVDFKNGVEAAGFYLGNGDVYGFKVTAAIKAYGSAGELLGEIKRENIPDEVNAFVGLKFSEAVYKLTIDYGDSFLSEELDDLMFYSGVADGGAGEQGNVSDNKDTACYNLSGNGYVAKSWNDPKVWYIDGQSKHWFPSEEVFFSWFKDFGVLKIVKQSALDALTVGDDVCLKSEGQTSVAAAVSVTPYEDSLSNNETSYFTIKVEKSGEELLQTNLYVNRELVIKCKANPCVYIGGPYLSANKYYPFKAPYYAEAVFTDNSKKTSPTGYLTISSGDEGVGYYKDSVKPQIKVEAQTKFASGSGKSGYAIKMKAAATDDSGKIAKVRLYRSNVANPFSSPIYTCDLTTSPSTCETEQGFLDLGATYEYWAETFDPAGNKATSMKGLLNVPAK